MAVQGVIIDVEPADSSLQLPRAGIAVRLTKLAKT